MSTATSIDETALLKAINANPADDTARLVYADWLDEHEQPGRACDQRLAVLLRAIKAAPGDDAPRLRYADVCEQYGRKERAEFIRVQCELAAFSPKHLCEKFMCRCAGCEQWNRLALTAWRLFCRNAGRWHGLASAVAHRKTPLDNSGERLCLESDDRTLIVHRGFVEDVRYTAADWLEHGDSIDAAHPVTKVTLTTGLDWHDDSKGRVILCEETANGALSDSHRMCRNIRYGQWWAAVGTVLEHILAAEWPHITFALPG